MINRRTNGPLMPSVVGAKGETQEAVGNQARWVSLAHQGFQVPLEYQATPDLPDRSQTWSHS